MNKFVTIISLSIILSYTGCNLSDCYKIEEDVSYEALNHILIGPIVYNDDFTVSLSDAAIFAASVRPNRCFKIEPYVLEKDTVLYFINYDEGWLIIAGDKRINPFVAESERGNLSMPTLNENLNVWIDSYADEIHVIRDLMKKEDNKFTELWLKLLKNKTQCIIKPQIPATKSAVYKWAVVKHTYCDSEQYQNVYPHLLTTKWGQGNPWNAKLPIDSNAGRRCFTGCTAVAISQILFYLHYHINKPLGLYHNIAISKSNISGKTTIIGFSRSGYVANSARWNQMALSAYSSGNYSYVGDLMLDVGNRVGMNYSGSGSGASISSSAMSHYNLTYTTSSYDYQTIRDNIIDSKPVSIVAWTQDRKGHSWVIDGIAQRIRHYSTHIQFEYTENWMNESEYYDSFDDLRYRYNINSEFDTITEDAGTYMVDFLLMNWGYDGTYDDAYYSTYPSDIWHANNCDWKYDKVISYDFT